MKISDQLLALLVVFIWGTNFVVIHFGLNELQPFTFAALRFSLVAIPLVFILPKPKVTWSALIGYGLFIGLGQFGLLFWAMREDISPGMASLIIQMQVFFTVFLSSAIFREPLSLRQFVSLIICFVGLSLVIGFTDGTTTLFGVLLVLIAGFSWACGNMVVKTLGKIDMLGFIAWSSLFAVPPLILLSWAFESDAWPGITNVSHSSWAILVWQVVGNTLIGYALWNRLLIKYTASLVAPWALLVPVFGILASAMILSEPLHWWKLAASALILLGLTINLGFGQSRRNR